MLLQTKNLNSRNRRRTSTILIYKFLRVRYFVDFNFNIRGKHLILEIYCKNQKKHLHIKKYI